MYTVVPLTPGSHGAVAQVHLAARAAYYAEQPGSPTPTAGEDIAYSAMWCSRLDASDWRLVGAFGGNVLLGFIATRIDAPAAAVGDPTEPRDGSVDLVALYVEPGHWNRGIGSLLYDAFVTTWRASGYRHAELDVWSLNHRALAFYAARGWLPDGRSRPAHAGTTYLRLARELDAARHHTLG